MNLQELEVLEVNLPLILRRKNKMIITKTTKNDRNVFHVDVTDLTTDQLANLLEILKIEFESRKV